MEFTADVFVCMVRIADPLYDHRGGVYLEMGALDGRLFSNTLFFQQTLDWSGVLIEPGILLSGPCSSSSSFTLNQYL